MSQNKDNAGLIWMAMMQGAYAAMPQAEREELERWEKENCDHSNIASSDWPGWEKYIGAPPWKINPVPVYKKQPIPKAVQIAVWTRDAYTCLQCGAQTNLCVDHIYPEVLGGTLEMNNLQTLCRSCNSRKGAKTQGGAA